MSLKISYIHGLCVKNDAISNSIRDEIRWLGSAGGNDIRLYSYECDYEDLPFTKVSDSRDIVFDHHFQSSGIVIFHFGIFYPLFDLLAITPKSAKRLVVFHNITPKQFVSAENHQTIDKSFQQMSNIMFADHVACVSQTNLDVLCAAGIYTPATILPLAVHSKLQSPGSKPSHLDLVVRLAFIGRFVLSKGPGELLEALDKVLQHNQSLNLILDMVGNLSFSDSVLLAELRNIIDAMHRSYGARVIIRIHGNVNDEIKHRILCDADLIVLPTYHEGFCVPIVEALASGCKVIAYENSNTPAISGGFTRLTPTGDVAALSCAITEVIEEITSPALRGSGSESYAEYSDKVKNYTEQYSTDRTKRRFLDFIKSF